MREIKVRGYCTEELTGSQWVTGFGILYSEFTEEYAKEVGREGECVLFTEYGRYEVESESVGEYTGLKDTDGREIYEGEVYEYTVEHDSFSYENGHTTFETKHRAVVEFSLGTFMLGDEILGDALEYDDSLRYLGNIYENKELLD